MPPSTSKTSKYKQRILLFETIQSYGLPVMACSNCTRYHRRCVVLNTKSQRCGECVRRGSKCDALQASVSDLENLRLEEERLKFERDTAFEAAMAGLARVRELELRQQELRERGMEMLRRGLKTLDELDEQENREREEKERQEHPDPVYDTFFPPNPDLVGAELAATLSAYDPADPFLATLGFGGGTPQASQNTEGLT